MIMGIVLLVISFYNILMSFIVNTKNDGNIIVGFVEDNK